MNRRQNQDGPQPLIGGGAENLDEQAAAKLLERYAVLEPDDLTVERVWQRLANPVSKRVDSDWRFAASVLAPVGLAFLVLLGTILLRAPTRVAQQRATPIAAAAPIKTAPIAAAPIGAAVAAELDATRGGVFFSRPAEHWQPGQDGQVLAESQWLRTDPSGMAVLDIPGVASVLLAPGTQLGIDRLNAGTFLRLLRGSVIARVSKRAPEEPFVILTDRYSVKVVGTLFQVDQDASDRTAVAVREGTVEIAATDGRTWRVQAGQRWISSEPGQLGASAIPDSVKTLLEDGLTRARAADLDRELEAVGQVSTSVPAGSSGRVPAEEFRLPPAVPAGVSLAHRSVRASSSVALAGVPPPPIVLAEREPIAGGRPANPLEQLAMEPAPIPTASPATTNGASSGAYGKGLALERRGELEAAAAELARAPQDDPEYADLALYALGRLYQNRLGNPRGALEAFQGYRSAYPQGALLPEVDLAVLEIEVKGGNRKEALAESVRFLASHPASERTDEVRRLRGDLLSEAGECRVALGEYAQVSAPASAEAALYGIARCQRKLGNWPAAKEALLTYRKRFPAGGHRDEVARELADESTKQF